MFEKQDIGFEIRPDEDGINYIDEGFNPNTQGENRATIRAHSDYYWHKPTNDWVKPFGEYFDIQCESKAKNLASAMLAHEYKLIKTGSVDF